LIVQTSFLVARRRSDEEEDDGDTRIATTQLGLSDPEKPLRTTRRHVWQRRTPDTR
jgi:hypothetical protein